MNGSLLRQLPSVNALQQEPAVADAIRAYGNERVTALIRMILNNVREQIQRGTLTTPSDDVTAQVVSALQRHVDSSLVKVINATGVILHTNLGRAVLGPKIMAEIQPIIEGYSNLEYDLETQNRGQRDSHIIPLLQFITGAEDAAVVNNNAAALILTLNTLAKGKEVIISRGELVEIGGSFRIPDILAASGAIMVEVGTTNKTHRYDYENAITDQTALILKAHKSNYDIVGFTQEVSLAELAELAHANGLPFVYDMGSGLIRKPDLPQLEREGDVHQALRAGVDVVTFSGDKLLGGSQAGILVGHARYLTQLKKAPMMRALRVDKVTLAILGSVMRAYLSDQTLFESLPFYQLLLQTDEELKTKANQLYRELTDRDVAAEILRNTGRCGGGTLPTFEIASYAVKLLSGEQSQKARSQFAEHIFKKLHQTTPPIIGVLRQADVLFDVLTLESADIPKIAQQISLIINQE